MARFTRKNPAFASSNRKGTIIAIVWGLFMLACVFYLYGPGGMNLAAPPRNNLSNDVTSSDASKQTAPDTAKSSSTAPETKAIQVSDMCSSLPKIEPNPKLASQDPECKKAPSKPGLEPSFHFGTFFPPDKVMYHMGGDFPHFQLLKEQTEGKTNSVTFDIGANQGFFSFYIAALGYDVHSFEIAPKNFEALQHGILYNPPEISNHVNLYQMGLSQKDGRFGISGGGYDGFLKEDPKGKILSLQMDCFAYHRPELFRKEISFIKIDVEGFEIGVLQGSKHSLFAPGVTIGSLIIEVGPNRWNRAGVSIDQGVSEMTELSTHFQESYVVLRKGDTCPGSKITPSISAPSPDRELMEVQLYKMTPSDWKPVLESMNENKWDCNFWFTNP